MLVQKPIPFLESPLPIENHKYINSPLVEIDNKYPVAVDMMYAKMGVKNSTNRCFVRQEVLEKLLMASTALPKGYYLKIWDAWRPLALQKELYNVYSKEIIRQFNLFGISEEKQKLCISKFVSPPETANHISPVHTTGGAVDVTLIDANGNEIDMGTGFDSFSKEAATAYFEKDSNIIVKENRRIIYNAMTSAGFTNLPTEWWHYDYGDSFWSYYTCKPVIYDGIYNIKDV